MSEKERMFLHFQRFQNFRSAVFSFFAPNFHLFFPTMPFETPIFLAYELSGKESRDYILLRVIMRSAILRNHLKFVSFPSYATSPDKEKRMKSQTCWANGSRPNFSFPSRHLVAQGELSRDSALSVLDRFFHFPFTPPRGTEQKSPTYCPIDRFFFLTLPRGTFCFSFLCFFFFCTTSLHRAEVPDTLLKTVADRPLFSFSFFFLHHLVAHFPFFFIPPRSTEQKCPTHC